MPVDSFLASELVKPYTKKQVELITRWMGADRQRFAELLSIFLTSEKATTQLAAGALSQASIQHPELVRPHLKKLVINLQKPVSPAVKRNTVRLLSHVGAPLELQGQLAGICFGYLQNPKEAVAVRAFSITVLAGICGSEPELKREFMMVLNEQLPFAGAGFRVRARKAMETLNSATFRR